MLKVIRKAGANTPQKKELKLFFWPSPSDYNEALQNPAQSFSDSVLGSGVPELDSHGLPRPISGMFASVYKLATTEGDWAVKCFLNDVPDQVERYSAISSALKNLELAEFIDFEFQERGVAVRGSSFPILKMRWCNGLPLVQWLEAKLTNTTLLEHFLAKWQSLLLDMSKNGIAHGDLQHGNILIEDENIRLVDYDCMYVPTLKGRNSNELGHRNYQHPQRQACHFGPSLDNFSAWLIYLSVKILRYDPGLWWEFRGGDDCLLLRSADLDNPLESERFAVLENHHSEIIRQCSKTIRYLLTLPLDEIPSLGSSFELSADLVELDQLEMIPAHWLTGELASNAPEDENPVVDLRSSSTYYGAKRQRSKRKGGSRLGARPGSSSSELGPAHSDSQPSSNQSTKKKTPAENADPVELMQRMVLSANFSDPAQLSSAKGSSSNSAANAQSKIVNSVADSYINVTSKRSGVDWDWFIAVVCVLAIPFLILLLVLYFQHNSKIISSGNYPTLLIRPLK